MKNRLLCLLLTLLLALGAVPALGEGAEAVKPPEAGDVAHGFEALEVRDYDALGARLTWFEHQKTGAKLMYIANNDINRAFQLTFRTRAEDDTGVPHVFEHATMYGNEKYPSKSLAMNLMSQTYNTFMNPATDAEMTVYPFSSLSEAQLLSLADFYTESCLHPLIMTDESIFRTQAWHYEMADMDSPLTYNGIVYSEMLGTMNLPATAEFNALRATFPGASNGYNHAGDPDHIPELTWEDVKAYHDRYYHPSNCIAYLYGDFDDYAAFLKLLDDAFSPYDRAAIGDEDDGYAPITEPVIESYPYPAPVGMDTAGQSVIYYFILCPGVKGDAERERLLDHAVEMLKTKSSPLMQGLKRALPGADFEITHDNTAPVNCFYIKASNVDPGDAETLRAAADEALAQIAREGFDPALADAVATRLRMDAKLARENGNPADFEGSMLFVKLAWGYFASGDPFRYVADQEALDDIVDENARGLLARAVGDWLAEPALYTLTTTYPEPGGREAKDAALAQKLAQIKAGMSEEELQAIVEATHAEPEEEDNSAMVAALKPITVADLPEECRLYEISDETGADGVRRIDAIADVDGVGVAALYFDIGALPLEDVHYARLLTTLLGKLETDAHTRGEVAALADRYLMRRVLNFYFQSVETEGDRTPLISFKWYALDEDLERSYALTEELLFHTRYDDVSALTELVSAEKANVRANINENGMLLKSMRRKMGIGNLADRYYDYCVCMDYYAFLDRLEAQLASDPQAAIDRLTSVQAFLANRRGAVSAFAGNEASIALNRPLADALLARLPDVARETVEYDLPVPAAREGIIIDDNIQYHVVAAAFEQMGVERDACLLVWNTLVTDRLLMPVLRERMGAYGAGIVRYDDDGLGLYVFRDPNVASTFEYLETLPGQIAEMEISQDELDGYIMNVYAEEAMPEGELKGAHTAIEQRLMGRRDDYKLVEMRQIKAATPQSVKDYAGVIEKLLANGGWGTQGSAAAINANAELYDVILNPFAAKD